MKEKVIKLLVKWGNNPAEVEKMVEASEWAFRSYSKARTIAEAISATK